MAAPLEFGLFDWLEFSHETPLAQIFEDRLRMLELADELGFYAYHVAQHEGTPLSLDGSPSVVIASAVQRTQRLKLVPTTYCLPWHNPLRLYHEICMLDQYSRGRLEVGIGRGASPIEGAYFGIKSPDDAREIAREVVDILVLAFTSSELNYMGKHFQYANVELYNKPYQQPYPPLWYPSSNYESVPYVAEHGFHTSHNFAPNDVARRHFDRYRDEYAVHAGATGRLNGHIAAPRLGNTRHVYVADTDALAIDQARDAFELWGRHISYLSGKFTNRPHDALTLESRMAAGTALVGSPDTVRRQIEAMVDESGVNYILGVFAFGDLPFERVGSSMRLFAHEVIPAFANRSIPHSTSTSPLTIMKGHR
jgi:alkanesulfonate monooxygenase SsuD/methylene tetrahydromethanopterin reductase-like flavin-dependent oxidoreductase (luciferase family)